MSEFIKPVIEYEREYGEAMAEALRYNPRASTHAITSPYWDAVAYALTHYDPNYPKYDKDSVLQNAVNLARNKLRGRVRHEIIERMAKSVKGLVGFLLDHADRYPRQKTWEVARAIRRSLAEFYYETVWSHIQEKMKEKAGEGE